DTIAPDEDRAIRSYLVEARPERRGRRVFDNYTIKAVQLRGVLFLNPTNAVEFCFLKPSDGRFDSINNPLVWMVNAHQKTHYPDALIAAQRDGFELSGGRRRKRYFIVLRAPDCAHTFDHDLSFEDALDSLLDRLFCLEATSFVNESVGGLTLSDVAQKSHDADHGVVVVGDVRVVALMQRVILR